MGACFINGGFEEYASRDYGKTLNVPEECLSFCVSGPDEGESFVKGSVRADERQLGVMRLVSKMKGAMPDDGFADPGTLEA